MFTLGLIGICVYVLFTAKYVPTVVDKIVNAAPTAAPATAPLAVLAVPTPTPTVFTNSTACQKIDDAFGNEITQRSKPNIPINYVRGQAFRSLDFGTYFIAVEFFALGAGNHVAIFVSPSLIDTSKVMAADEMAKAFTTWPDVSKTDPMMGKARSQMDRAVICLR